VGEPIAADLLASRQLKTLFGVVDELLYRYANSDIVVVGIGNWKNASAPLARIHSACFAAHYLWSAECDCREQLDIAFRHMQQEGAGILVFLDQDGRGNGHAALMRAAVYASRHGCNQAEAYASLGYPPDARSFTGAGVVLRALGVSAVRLMTNNPKKIDAVGQAGIDVVSESVVSPAAETPWLAAYYQLKAQEGHRVARPEEETL
jgi:3,4-dihydroxy 2-butanone 4-phosphate synthase/GTP cyclohydrolase II